jgi:hypothetical protein
LSVQVPPLRFLNIGGNSIGDDGAAIVSQGLVEAAGLRLLMLRFLGLDNNSMYGGCSSMPIPSTAHFLCSILQINEGYDLCGECAER